MNKTLSTNVTQEQYNIIKKIAIANKTTVSKILKASAQVYMALYYMNDIFTKAGFEKTRKDIERNAQIRQHSKELADLMQPYVQQFLSSVPSDVMKAIEDEGEEFEETMKKYNKQSKRGRPPRLIRKIKEDI